MQNLDQIDLAILDLLQKDSSMSVKDISQKVGLSATPTYERIKFLESSGVIEKYTVILNREKIGISLIAYCNIILKEQSKKALLDFEKACCQMDEVLEIISLSGKYDYMIKVVAKDITSYNDFIVNKLSNVANIGQYHSNIVMSMPKHETSLPVKST